MSYTPRPMAQDQEKHEVLAGRGGTCARCGWPYMRTRVPGKRYDRLAHIAPVSQLRVGHRVALAGEPGTITSITEDRRHVTVELDH